MKRLTGFFVLTFLVSSVLAQQKTATEYLIQIPHTPDLPCERDMVGGNDFKGDIAKVLSEMSKDIAARNKKARDYMKGHEKEARETAVKNSGLVLTPKQMKVMQQENKHMTQAQKDQLADQVMQQNMNVSMAELDKLKKGGKHVDSTAAANWAQGYSTELNAEREINPEKAHAAEIRNKQTNDLVKEMNNLQQRLYAGEDKYTQQLNDLQYLADSLFRILLTHTNPMRAKIDTLLARLAREKAACSCAMEEASKKVDAEVTMLQEEILTLNYMYCPYPTNKYLEILGYYRGYIESTVLPNINHLEELQAEIHYRQTGIRDPEFRPGLLAIQAVYHYAELVSNVYKYKINDRPLNDEEKKQMQTIQE